MMNIRKHWKRILMSTTALFWASCGSDSESTAPIYSENTSSSCDIPVSSSEFIESSSAAGPSSSSEVVQSSSSDVEQPVSSAGVSSSSAEPLPESSSAAPLGKYKLAANPSVTCLQKSRKRECAEYGYVETKPKKSDPEINRELRDSLENNTTMSLFELERLETRLEKAAYEYAPVYGAPSVPKQVCVKEGEIAEYECSDGKIYSSKDHFVRSLLIYTEEEFYKKFPSSSSKEPESSSSEQQSSSSAESSSSVAPPSPLCTKSDFLNVDELREEFENDKKVKIDSVKNTLEKTTLEAKDSCFNSIGINYSSVRFVGSVATKQTCDGESIVNPRYQAKLDSNNAHVDREIGKCVDGE